MMIGSKTESECCTPAASPHEVGLIPEANYPFPDELVLNKFVSSRDKGMQSFEQIQAFPRPSVDVVNPQYVYLTTTASSSDQIIDHSSPAFPIKEFEDFKRPKKALESSPELGEVQACENDLVLNDFKSEEFNSVIKEDKEKRKVIVEWVNNNEWSCKQWSCKKFGKEGAAKRAIQFLERIHGVTISCLPGGFYSTLLELGSIEGGGKSAYSRRGSESYSERSTSKKRSKAAPGTGAQRQDSSSLGPSPSSSSFKLHQSHELQTVSLIQKMMLLFSPLGSDSFEAKGEAAFGQPRSQESEQFDWERLHSNCRRQLRRLVLESARSKKFLPEELDLLLSQAAHTPGAAEPEQTEENHYPFVDKSLFDSLLGAKTVRDVLNMTVRSELKLFYAAKDIMQVIGESEGGVAGLQAREVESALWDKSIESVSRINDDLTCLSGGGFPGYSSLACSNYGNGFFQFNSEASSGSAPKTSFNAMINHKKSCMNLVHIGVQDNGYRCLYPNCERRRIATRLHGKTLGPDSCEPSNASPSKPLKPNSTLKDSELDLSASRHVGSAKGGKCCMQMLNGIYTLLDLKYMIKGGQSKEILCDALREGLVCSSGEAGDANTGGGSCKRKSFGTGGFQGQLGSESKAVRKRRSATNDSGSGAKMQRLDHEKAELQKSRIEWWKKPRGWKVTYFNKDGEKCSQIFRVSLNSSSVERESQYRLAYSFYLSTLQEVKEGEGVLGVEEEDLEANNENSNTINGGNAVCGAGVENTVPFNFVYGVPGIFDAVNYMQMLNTGINSSGFMPNNVPVLGNVLAMNYCFPGVVGGCNAPLICVGVNGGSSMVQSDQQGFNHLGLENHSGVGVSSFLQKPYQPYAAFIKPMHPFMIPIFPPLMQGFSLSQSQSGGGDGAGNHNTATGWHGWRLDGTGEIQASSDKIVRGEAKESG